jgi:tetratricopeptide (TPR) repeat protein
MIALALSIVHRNDKKIEEHFKLAMENYIIVGDFARASRVALWANEVYKSSRSTTAAQFLLAVADKDGGLRSGILYEQAGLVFLHSRPSYRRKYAFYSALAGEAFQKLEKHAHASRCYYKAFSVIENKNWSFAEDTTRLEIARVLLKIGDVENAIQNFVALFTQKSDTFSHHQLKKHLQEFQQVIVQYSLFDQEFFIDIPAIGKNIEIMISDRYTLLPSLATSVWINGMDFSDDHYLNFQSKFPKPSEWRWQFCFPDITPLLV